MPSWKPIRVTILLGTDELDAQSVFDAFTDGDRWNGWTTPAFTREEGQRIAAWTAALAERYPDGSVERVWWNEERRAFVVEDPSYPHVAGQPVPEEDMVSGFWCAEVGRHLYGIGAYKWTWEEVTATEAPVGMTA